MKVLIHTLRENPENPRSISKEKFEKLVNSIRQFPEMMEARPIVVDQNNVILGGNMRFKAAKEAGLQEVDVYVASWDEAKNPEFIIKDNVGFGEWDWDMLANEWDAVLLDDWGLDVWQEEEEKEGLTDPDEVPEVPADPVTQLGDLWILGEHRLLCGDSTKAEDVARLMNAETATLLHADPPYGMGKQKDGVLNDNLYNEKLDKFQMDWWRTFRPHLASNASAYVWGNAPDLWRLWYRGGLADSERLELRNEIVWDKKAIPGMKSDLMHQYPEASERCLYIQFGQQFVGNLNSEDFPEEWEPLRSYLAKEAEVAGIDAKRLKELCGVGMFSHWFTKSQFCLIPEKHYLTLQQHHPQRFLRPWSELAKEWSQLKKIARGIIGDKHQAMRSYFNNGHDVMRDVWEFGRVIGDERHNHATPKPVEMMERVMKSSSQKNDIVVEPFLGSGSTLMGAEVTGRKCYGMELDPGYCDTIVRRWEGFTGEKASKANA